MKPASLAPVYALAYPVLAEAARSVGYALAIHGTLNRDCDLVAIPWTEEAGDVNALIVALTTRAMLKVVPHNGEDGSTSWDPQTKPHGRIAYTFMFDYGAGASFDVSIMPRLEKP